LFSSVCHSIFYCRLEEISSEEIYHFYLLHVENVAQGIAANKIDQIKQPQKNTQNNEN
jgi:hypothetical protein